MTATHQKPWVTAWIIGGSSGLGAETARQLATQGCRTYVSARSVGALTDLCKENTNLVPLPLDITDRAACKIAADTVVAELGHLPDLIILNAAVYTPMGVKDFSATAIQTMVDVNYMGIVHMFDALLPFRTQKQRTVIASVTSPSGWRGLPGGVGYAPTKAALINLVEGLRCELIDTSLDLRIVNPGFIRTRLTEKNSFSMPQLMEPADAAQRMLKGLSGASFETAFPRPFVSVLRLLSRLPYWLYFRLMKQNPDT
ncbi:oxidoreductase [Kordiimonas sediminis]|uniref:Oxidoreductase n=1 Tax=Kordiimonas sediminis TaxID=1735581 RepID=A0A919E1Y6_9PROT|nr:SDR family NAD(P)-dependent oxidoreductase [Kordiimonas sediminis]GHF11433.1 oxidoreductase [Kordiimonas sediminis]